MRIMAGQRGEFGLDAPARERLVRHAEAAGRPARRAGGGVGAGAGSPRGSPRPAGARAGVAAVTVPLDGPADPAAIVAGSRAADDPWFVLEHPDAAGTALAAVGCV